MMGEVPMKRLDGAVVYASRRGSGLLPFDSKGERKETGAASAARCSMSIPLVFVPEIVDRRRVFDGGLLANFPLTTFLKDHYRSNFIALYLGKPDHKSKRFFGRELLDIIIDRDDFKTVDENSRSVVVIDTSPIGTIDFGMTAQEKEFLLKVGKAAALQWLVDRKLDDGPAPAEADKAMAEAEAARMLITTLRKRQRVSRISWAAFLIAIFAALYMLDVFAYLSRVVRYFVP
jgi:predicted acylesterase/phospholipase RssA